jgi:hypothetical protein
MRISVAEWSADMGFLSWMKGQGNELQNPNEYPRPDDIALVWQASFKVQASGYLAAPCVGQSEKGYHPGLVVIAHPTGKTDKLWGSAAPTSRQAMEESADAYSGWVEAHEADAKGREVNKTKSREAPSWER